MPALKFVLTIVLVILLSDASAVKTAVAEHTNDVVTSKLIKCHGCRKIMTEILDYDYGGANSRHDPRKKPGIGH